MNHPRTNKGEKYSCCGACCFEVGNNCLCSPSKNQDVDRLGLGVSLYFKFLKSSISFIFLILLMNGILFLVYNRSKLLDFQTSSNRL
jgi:hypothetical protein